ncbi:metallophosphoesterase [Pseudomonas thivervalensis]|uniref:metallophosphoesterase n=1 Tax=Pseudomonas thivervalensis TaxID=86265 RepID=UPI00069CF5EE|nr:metallophosphoesterase [Pseudomonas thivervalensis]OAB50149.1 phosphoprotein phosphatase [Pseudomonas thivervalensis]SDF85663.1 serine/threonine protein phosphatase 1 [Pseudomonas thivervalensis]
MYRTKSFPPNKKGRDFVVGDIHGHFKLLTAALNKLDFNTELDRIFSVGDLIDRGPDSIDVLNWLEKPWFHAVRGNHEQMLIDCISGYGDIPRHIRNGGAWLYELQPDIQQELSKALQALPLIIEINLPSDQTIGIVHAEIPVIRSDDGWQEAKDAITGSSGEPHQRQALKTALYAREKIEQQDLTSIKGIDRLYVGHSTVPSVIRLGNVVYIDTGCSFSDGALSLVDIQTETIISISMGQ